MKISADERSTDNRSETTNYSRYLWPTIAVLFLIAIAWLVYDNTTGDRGDATESASQESIQHAVVEPPSLVKIPKREIRDIEFELPNLADSDPLVREKMSVLGDSLLLDHWRTSDNLIQRSVAFADGLSRGIFQRKLLNLPSPPGKFQARKEGETFWLDETNYPRFDSYRAAFEILDSKKLAQMFHLLRPLLQQAYGDIGYNPDNVDSAIIGAIDHLLAAPVMEKPIQLTRNSVNYQFADPRLEKLPPAHKLLLRTGPENTRRIQAKLKEIRHALLDENLDADN